MGKKLNIDDMLEIARDLELKNYDELVRQAEEAAGAIANSIAAALEVNFEPASWDGKDFGGLCVTFRPALHRQECPEPIDDADPSGDWE